MFDELNEIKDSQNTESAVPSLQMNICCKVCTRLAKVMEFQDKLTFNTVKVNLFPILFLLYQLFPNNSGHPGQEVLNVSYFLLSMNNELLVALLLK